MKVVVTGGSGFAGSAIVQHLIQDGIDVRSVDIVPPSNTITDYKIVNCEDIGQVYGALVGADAVIHAAAIPRPIFHTPEQVFRTNVMASFNVFEVVANLGIQRVVYLSSVSVLGLPFAYTPVELAYVPIDEDHPKVAEDAYALSKTFSESLADAAVRRCEGRLNVVSLRFPWVHTPETFKAQLYPHWDDPAFGAINLWSYIDTRDVAEICRLALKADLTGHEVFFASAADSFMNQDIVPLIRQFYPNAVVKDGFAGNRSLLDNSKASNVMGFRSRYAWKDYRLNE